MSPTDSLLLLSLLTTGAAFAFVASRRNTGKPVTMDVAALIVACLVLVAYAAALVREVL